MKQSIIFGIVALLSVAPALASTEVIALSPPSVDPGSQDWGLAKTVSKGSTQVFMVRADLDWRDGTKLVVAVEIEDRDGDRAWYDVAIMEVRLGTASMTLDSGKDISVAFPVSAILGVKVVRRGSNQVCLEGTFED